MTWACLGLFLLLQLLCYWCIGSLGEQWNTRIIVIPGGTLSRRGPYRWFRHPNDLVVNLDLVVVPLLARAPLTLLGFSLANLVLLRQRIRLEEAALTEHEDLARVPGESLLGVVLRVRPTD